MTEVDVAWTLVAVLGAGFVAVIVLFLGTIVQVVIRLRGQIDEVRYFLRHRFGFGAMSGNGEGEGSDVDNDGRQ